jgi:crossover junction endodeoxyribonuclease RuvC
VKPDYVLGCDPGLHGALALLDTQAKSIEAIFDMPVTDGQVDAARLAGIVEMCNLKGLIVAAVELVQSRPRQSGSHAFGVSVGIVYGVLGALNIPLNLIPASQWKPAMGLRRMLNESQAENKSRARLLATKSWPEHTADFAKVKFDGRAEAALISRFWASKNGWI